MAADDDSPFGMDSPFCKACGYSLTGLTESSRCPECGRPIVDVLTRGTFPGQGQRYVTARAILGLPLLAIASGPFGAERYGKPVGVIAIGDRPRGVIAIGGLPIGFIAIGGFARGFIAIGGVALGAISLGGFSVGVAAFGGVSLGCLGIRGNGVRGSQGMGRARRTSLVLVKSRL